MTYTHTFALIEVSPSTYLDIRRRLGNAGYQDQIHDDDVLDMHGIGIRPQPDRIIARQDDIYRKIRDGNYNVPNANDKEVISTVTEHFRRDALLYVGLDGHPRADEIYAFACRIGSAGGPLSGPLTTVWALEQIAAFLR